MTKKLLLITLILTSVFSFSQKELTQEVYFETDKYDVPITEENRLLLFISTLSDIDIDSISIFGFCDDIGAHTYNLKLSQQRAEAIKAIFANNEISESLITNVDGKGEILLKIVEEKNILKIRGLNRKVEIIVKSKPPKPIVEETKPDVKEKDAVALIKESTKGDKIIFKNILFKTGYASVTPASKKVLTDIAEALVERKDVYFTIQGHVCCTQYTRDAVDRRTKKETYLKLGLNTFIIILLKKVLAKNGCAI